MSDSRPHVLIVDDLEDQADSMAELLGLWGYVAAARYDAAGGLVAARARVPVAVILDLGMPGMDGFEFVARFRKLPGCGATPVVAVTGYETLASRVRQSGMAYFLVKPVESCHLRSIVERLAVSQPIPFTAEPQPEQRATRSRGGTLGAARWCEVAEFREVGGCRHGLAPRSHSCRVSACEADLRFGGVYVRQPNWEGETCSC